MRRYDDYREPFTRRLPVRPRRLGPIVAWDLETTRLPRTPEDRLSVDLRYFTAHGADIRLSRPVDSIASLGALLVRELLVVSRLGTRYCSWNGNRFDTFFLLRAVLGLPEFRAKPWIANQAGLRGVRVYHQDDEQNGWDFCDGMAMTGLQCSLDEFSKKFAPAYRKMTGQIDFEGGEEFDPSNPLHIAYAERDSEALYHGLTEAERIMLDLTGRQLHMTIGASGIRFFERSIPEDVKVMPLPERAWRDVFHGGLRGGYVYVARQHDGLAWQYDINQAYAAAMRDEQLPAGRAMEVMSEIPDTPGLYRCVIARDPRSLAPFYVRDLDRDTPCETHGDMPISTILTSSEVAILRRHAWTVQIERGWTWSESFTMSAMVDQLEAIRIQERGCVDPTRCTCPSDAIGTMCKAIGNNAYGKTTERLSHEHIVLSAEKPGDEFFPYRWEDDAAYEGFWVKIEQAVSRRRYHRPHLGMFITAHVRCKLYDAIMAAPDAFLKADTDSIMFSRSVKHLDLSPTRYGAWKLEYDGSRALVVGKKCYAIAGSDGSVKKAVCKGLRVKSLTVADYERWIHEGIAPVQVQVQKLGWRRGLPSTEYRVQERRGTDFRKTATHLFT